MERKINNNKKDINVMIEWKKNYRGKKLITKFLAYFDKRIFMYCESIYQSWNIRPRKQQLCFWDITQYQQVHRVMAPVSTW